MERYDHGLVAQGEFLAYRGAALHSPTEYLHEMSITADVNLQVSNKSKDMTYAQSVREKIQQIEIRGQMEF
jgi:hypothetical protein